MSEVVVYPDAADLHEAAASMIAEGARRAVDERGRFLLVLAGGSTPRGVYQRLAARHTSEIQWERVHLFWGDERCVPPAHPRSNFRMVAETLLPHVGIPSANVHRIHGEYPPEQGAAQYREVLRHLFDAERPAELGTSPGFDLVLLGIGADGHTASLFPGSAQLDATGWAEATEAPPSAPVRDRITLSLPAINSARDVLFLVTGADKRHTVVQVLATTGTAPPLPAARIRPRGRVRWLLDSAAAGSGLVPGA